jgi:hypothetical protein
MMIAVLLPPLLTARGDFAATFHKPALVGESNYTHFWMPQPLFRLAALEGKIHRVDPYFAWVNFKNI